jgi:uncharacterized small protein (DUF1192 family)
MDERKKDKLPTTDPGDAEAPKRLTVEELEERVALSVPAQKKIGQPAPYPPGADYGLVKRSNVTEQEPEKAEPKKPTVEELEERVALSVPAQKKVNQPAPYPPGTRYGLVKRSNL